MNSRILALAVSALAATTAVGQINPNIGTPLGATDDSISMVTVSFPVVFPGGGSQTDLYIDSNGRISSNPAEPSDFTESTAEFFGELPAMAPYWDDLNPSATIGDLFFNDLGTSALITWNDTVLFAGAPGTEFTVQAEIFPDGTIVFAYDNRTPAFANDGITGLSEGNGVVDPGATDLTGGTMSMGVGTIYENYVGNLNDLNNGTLTFTPDGSGGYNLVSTIIAPTPSSVTVNGPACTPQPGVNTSTLFTPDGSGGYNTTPNGGAADMNFASGTPLGLTDDSTANVVLPFMFTMPGGASVGDLDVDSNGRLFQTGLEFSDFTESVAEFLGDATAIIAPYWDDLNPAAGGTVWANVAASGAQSITWDGVPEFGTTNSNTFQVQLFADGSVSFHYLAIVSVDGLVGLSSGNGAADPGASDLSAGPVMTSGGSVVYELFTGNNDLGTPQLLPSLINSSNPVIGTNFDLAIINGPGSIGDFYLLGNPSTFDLSPIGIPCSLETDGILATISTAPGAGYTLAIPNLPGLVGQSLNTQGAILDPGAGNPFFVLFTNSVDFTFGDI